MKKILGIPLMLIAFCIGSCFAQDHRYKSDSLEGVYIPKNLNDAINQINTFWSDSTKYIISQWEEDEFSGKVHLGFGMWLRNNWGLWKGSRLSKYFNDMGIYHPDDMSGIILTSYHRRLVGTKIRLKPQIRHYKSYWRKAEKKSKNAEKIRFKEYNVSDTVQFYYTRFISENQETLYMDDKCIAYGLILGKDKKNYNLKIRLLESCDTEGIILFKDHVSDGNLKLVEKNSTIVMKKGEVQWISYELWIPQDDEPIIKWRPDS